MLSGTVDVGAVVKTYNVHRLAEDPHDARILQRRGAVEQEVGGGEEREGVGADEQGGGEERHYCSEFVTVLRDRRSTVGSEGALGGFAKRRGIKSERSRIRKLFGVQL